MQKDFSMIELKSLRDMAVMFFFRHVVVIRAILCSSRFHPSSNAHLPNYIQAWNITTNIQNCILARLRKRKQTFCFFPSWITFQNDWTERWWLWCVIRTEKNLVRASESATVEKIRNSTATPTLNKIFLWSSFDVSHQKWFWFTGSSLCDSNAIINYRPLLKQSTKYLLIGLFHQYSNMPFKC